MRSKVANISRKDILDYLMENPSFFSSKDKRTLNTLNNIEIPHGELPANTISLLEYQNKLLRREADKAQSLHKQSQTVNRFNKKVIHDIHAGVLEIIKSKNLQEIGETLDYMFIDQFKVQGYKLILFVKARQSKSYDLMDKSSAPKELKKILEQKSFQVGSLPQIIVDLLFRDNNIGDDKDKTSKTKLSDQRENKSANQATKKSKALVKLKNNETDERQTTIDDFASFLLMPLYPDRGDGKRPDKTHHDDVFGLICLASSDEQRFSEDLSIDYVDFLFNAIRLNLVRILKIKD